jgi:glycerol-3-phosphate dehydrogenase
MELVAAEWCDGRWNCRLKDHVSGEVLELKAKALVNAAGPFADKINRLLGIDCPFKHILSKGAHIVVPQITPTRHVLTFFASDGRLFFMIPMGARTSIGTTDTRVDGEVVEPTADDVEFLLANANALLNLEPPLTKADVIARRCGVRPLVVKKEADVGNAEWSALSRKHEIDVHPERNLCSIYGGKLTDCINVGEEVAALIASFGLGLRHSSEPWFGEPGKDEKIRFTAECDELELTTDQGARLWRRYGRAAFQCLEKIRTDHSMAEVVIEHFTRAELQLIAESEMLVHLEDFLRRRSRLALTLGRDALRADPGLNETARILFGENSAAELECYFGKG